MSSQRQICTVYKVFGDCATGAKKCTDKHKGKHGKQTFLIALITKMSKDGKIVSIHGKQTPYYISHGSWHRNGGQEGDLVAFQESSVKAEVGYNWVRIVAVYGKINSLPDPRTIEIEKSAFMLDTPGTQHYEDALSMADCSQHDNCKIIGIHIAIIANSDKLSINQLPYYTRNKYDNFKIENQSYFNIDKWNFAISIYLHSNCKSVIKPQINIVKITNNCTIGEDTSQCKSNVDLSKLLQSFTHMANKMSYERNAAYLCRIPKSWRKDSFIVGEAISIFNSAVVNYLKEIPTNPAFFITGTSQRVYYSTTQTIFIPEDVFPNANDCDDKIPMLIAQVNQNLKSYSDSTNQLSPRYERDVKSCSELQQETDVKFTAPMRKIQSFVNQQVLFGLLVNSGSCLYSKKEQLGILGIRFRTPILCQSVINGIKDGSFRLDHISLKNMYENVCDIKCTELHDKCKGGKGEISMEFKNTSSIEYSNFQVISFSKPDYDKMFSEFCGGQDSGKWKEHLLAMDITPQDPTYSKVNNTNTRLFLQTGTTLHLQISTWDSYENNNLGLRLLRMGKNCHLCLLHMNHPELAFMSDRTDIRSLDLEKKITVLKERKLTDEKLDTVRLTDVIIEWSDDYYSGGLFNTDEKKITIGDALCICKEVKDVDNSNIKYVWNSHAVVTERNKGDVHFAVCTLSQTHGAPKGDDDYCVEIICTKKKWPVLDIIYCVTHHQC